MNYRILFSCFFGIFNGFSDFKGVTGVLERIENYPFQVSIELNGKPICSGGIIGDHWIITSQSCIRNQTASSLMVRAGSSELGHNGVSHITSKIVVYQKKFAMFGVPDVELAMLKVESPFTYSDNILWTVPDVEMLPNKENLYVTGWNINQGGNQFQRQAVKLLSHDECVKTFENRYKVSEIMDCLVSATNSDNACIADVGAPIVVDGLITAVVANNQFCHSDNLPIIVSNVGRSGFMIAMVLSEPILRIPLDI